MAYGTIKVDTLVSTSGTVDLTTVTTSDATTSASGYMSAADKTKLDGIEASATADQTGAEIKAAYEGEADTNAFTDADHTKLDGIEAGAQVNVVTSVNTATGAVVLDADDIDDASTTHKFVTAADVTALGTLSTDLAAKADLVGGVLDSSQLPDIAVSEYKGAVANETAMLAITGEKGDWVIRNDDSKVYVITGDDPSSASDWTALSYPAGFSGAYADLTGKPTLGTAAATDSTAYATAAQGTLADSATQPGDLATVATTGAYGDLSGTPTIPPNNNQLTNGAGYVTSSGNTIIGTDTDIDTSGATVIDTLTMTDGVITAHSTRTMTLGDLGYTGATNANYITNNNQLTNGAGYITSADGGDASTLNGVSGTYYARTNTTNTFTGSWFNFDDNKLLRFGTGADAEFFCNGSHFYLDLNSGIGNFYIRDGSTTRFTFDDAGHFTATGNVTAYSDINLKENIEVIPNALEKVSEIRGVTYDRKDMEGPRHAGVIAQEVEAVLPEVVMTDEEGVKSVAYGNLVGLLIEAVKELKAEVETLKQERN